MQIGRGTRDTVKKYVYHIHMKTDLAKILEQVVCRILYASSNDKNFVNEILIYRV